MKKGILIVLILIILFGGLVVCHMYINEEGQKENTQSITNNENEKEIFEVKKVENEQFNSSYKITENGEIEALYGLIIEKQNDELTIIINKTKTNEMLLEKENGITYSEKYRINNINAEDVKSTFCGIEGQEAGYPLIFILQKDGTVKGIDMVQGYKTGKFVANNISGLKNVEKIQQADVTPENDSGYMAVVAITKDDSKYEIRMK